MALQYQPHPGTLWMCNFDTGFEPPEMVKVRPVVVISPQPLSTTGLCTVVPLSTTPPNPVQPFHHRMERDSLPAGKLQQSETWAKCDMLSTISLQRLRRATKRRPGVAATFRVLETDFDAIRNCVKIALGLDTTPGECP